MGCAYDTTEWTRAKRFQRKQNPVRNRTGVAQSPKLPLTGELGYNNSVAECNKNPHATSVRIV
jgi:hypothetical protein